MKHTYRFTTSLTLVAIISALIYLSAARLGYQWQLEKVPGYFVNKAEISVRTPIDGQVVAIDTGTITLESEDKQSITLTADEIDTDMFVGEFVEEDDIVAYYSAWRLGPLAKGLLTTIMVCVLACVFGFFLSIPLALCRSAKNLIGETIAMMMIELVRGTPLLVQLFIIYFLFGTFFNLSSIAAGIISLTIFASVYYAEIIRGGLAALPKGQAEVAKTLGLSSWQTFRYVLLPQALQNSIPALIGQTVNIVKDSSLLSVIAVAELTKNAREVVASSFASFEVWLTVAVMYLALCALIGAIGRRLEARYA